MRYALTSAVLFAAGAMAAMQAPAVNQIGDGQVQEQVSQSAPVETATTENSPVKASTTAAPEETVYSTKKVVITSCEETVTNCPARETPITSYSVIPHVSGTPVVVTSSTPVESVVKETSTATEAVSTPNSPVEVSSAPVYSAAPTTAVETATTPSSPVETTPASPASPETSAACPTCPTCPSSAVTVYSTVTVSPGQETPAAGTPAAGTPASPSAVNANSPVQNSPAAGAAAPAGSKAPYSPNSPVGAGAPGSGAAAVSGTGVASTGGVSPSSPTSSPITPFKGAASTIGSSMAITAVAALAAIFLA